MGKSLRNKNSQQDQMKDIYEKADKTKVKHVKNMFDQYSGKSEDDLKDTLLKMASDGKKDGSLNNETIDDMAKKIMPMLDKSKKQKLNSILKMIKDK